jgi:hypothetical protein
MSSQNAIEAHKGESLGGQKRESTQRIIEGNIFSQAQQCVQALMENPRRHGHEMTHFQ